MVNVLVVTPLRAYSLIVLTDTTVSEKASPMSPPTPCRPRDTIHVSGPRRRAFRRTGGGSVRTGVCGQLSRCTRPADELDSAGGGLGPSAAAARAPAVSPLVGGVARPEWGRRSRGAGWTL